MTRAAAFLWAAGGTLALAVVVAGTAPGSIVPLMTGIGFLALATAAFLFWLGGRATDWFFHILLVTGTVLIGALTIADRSRDSAFQFVFIWVALWVYYFFPLRAALVHTLWVGIVAAAAISIKGTVEAPRGAWILIMGTMLVSGLLINRLVLVVNTLTLLDPLTRVANRRRFDQELPRELARASRGEEAVSVAIIDLDRFKAFNDDMGHVMGDHHLTQTARMWQSVLRPGDVLARFGGEEFTLILPRTKTDDAIEIVNRLRDVTPNGQTCSAGIATWDGRETHQGLIARADAALFGAKVAGRDRTIAAAKEVAAPGAQLPQHWANLVPELIESRAVRAVFQPMVDLTTGRVVAYEALARPLDADDSLSVEGLFLAAQRMGRGRDLDWLCRRVCIEAARVLPPGSDLSFNVGVPAFMARVHPVDQLVMVAEWAERRPETIILEITERDVVGEIGRFCDLLAEYRECGFRFAIDDIGDGHSTLEVLAAARPEFVKIARSLTSTVDRLGSRAAISAIVAFARSAGSMVVAEGIETEHERDTLRELGATLGQGFALGRPRSGAAWGWASA